MSARSVLGMLYTLQALEAEGIPCGAVLAEHGLSLNNLDPSALIERYKELAIYQKLLEQTHHEKLGLKLGSTFGLAGYGPYSMLLLTSANAFEACKVGLKFQQLAYIYGEMGFEIKADRSTLFIEPQALPAEISQFILDRDLSGMMKMVEDIAQELGQKIEIHEAKLPYPEPKDVEPYEQRFGCPVTFGHTRSELITDNAVLTQPLPQANTLTHQYYQAQCEQLLAQQARFGDSLAYQVSQYISLFTDKFPAIQDVCSHLGMPERTLRRHLSEEGTRFQSLLDEVRLRKAKQWLLKGDANMETIAQRLGYAEPAAFNHAFKRWTGQSPSAFRKSLIQP